MRNTQNTVHSSTEQSPTFEVPKDKFSSTLQPIAKNYT